MMKTIRVVILLTCCFLLAPQSLIFASTDNAAWQNEASQLYDNGDYGKAYKKYLKLGKKGDLYSSYRVSYMNLKGQGTKTNIIESLAWAVLAAQDGEEHLVSYRDAVAALVPLDKREKAQSKADYYVRRWGKKDPDEKRKPQSGCTSSRIAASCGESSGGGKLWIAWPSGMGNEAELQETIEELNSQIATG